MSMSERIAPKRKPMISLEITYDAFPLFFAARSKMMKSIPTRATGKVMSKKVGTDLYVLKKNANAILRRMNMDPPMSGFFQEMSNVSTRINEGISCTKKPAQYLVKALRQTLHHEGSLDFSSVHDIPSWAI